MEKLHPPLIYQEEMITVNSIQLIPMLKSVEMEMGQLRP